MRSPPGRCLSPPSFTFWAGLQLYIAPAGCVLVFPRRCIRTIVAHNPPTVSSLRRPAVSFYWLLSSRTLSPIRQPLNGNHIALIYCKSLLRVPILVNVSTLLHGFNISSATVYSHSSQTTAYPVNHDQFAFIIRFPVNSLVRPSYLRVSFHKILSFWLRGMASFCLNFSREI